MNRMADSFPRGFWPPSAGRLFSNQGTGSERNTDKVHARSLSELAGLAENLRRLFDNFGGNPAPGARTLARAGEEGSI